jgi:predicted phage tail protein
MTKIVLHGMLGRVVGTRVWRLAVQTPAEAIRAIEANTGRLVRHLMNHEGGKAAYRVILDGSDHERIEDITTPMRTPQTIHFVPVLSGAGSNGIWQIVIGVILVAAAFYLGPTTGSLFSTSLGTGIIKSAAVATFVGTFGVSLILGGIAQALAPSPHGNFGDTERPENQPSYLFNGAVNTTRQGNPVPVGYGRLRVGSQLVSVGLRTEEIPVLP